MIHQDGVRFKRGTAGSEREIFLRGRGLFDLLYLRLLGNPMHAVGVDIDRLERFRRTGMFTCAATDAEFLPHFGDDELFHEFHHRHCLRGAMFRARAAIGVLRIDDAIVLDELRDPELCQLLLLFRQREERS